MADPTKDELVSRWEAQARKGWLELSVLATLWADRHYGLEILRRLQADGLDVGEGTLYPLLTRLRKDDLVATEWVEGELGHPRKYYQLTDSGRELARFMARRWRSFGRTLDTVVAPITKEINDE